MSFSEASLEGTLKQKACKRMVFSDHFNAAQVTFFFCMRQSDSGWFPVALLSPFSVTIQVLIDYKCDHLPLRAHSALRQILSGSFSENRAEKIFIYCRQRVDPSQNNTGRQHQGKARKSTVVHGQISHNN